MLTSPSIPPSAACSLSPVSFEYLTLIQCFSLVILPCLHPLLSCSVPHSASPILHFPLLVHIYLHLSSSSTSHSVPCSASNMMHASPSHIQYILRPLVHYLPQYLFNTSLCLSNTMLLSGYIAVSSPTFFLFSTSLCLSYSISPSPIPYLPLLFHIYLHLFSSSTSDSVTCSASNMMHTSPSIPPSAACSLSPYLFNTSLYLSNTMLPSPSRIQYLPRPLVQYLPLPASFQYLAVPL